MRLSNGKSLVVGTYHRSGGLSYHQLIQLSAFLDTLENDTITLAVYFNLPDIEWSCDNPAASVTGLVFSAFLDLVCDFVCVSIVYS